MADPTDTETRIALARNSLTAKLAELRRREARVRTALSPMRHLANPWLRVGVAALVGYQLGRRKPGRAAIEAPPARTDTVFHALVRAGLIAVAQAVVRRVVIQLGAASGDASGDARGDR